MSVKCILAGQVNQVSGGGGSGVIVKKLEITKYPVKTTYLSGDSFDPTGMELTASYGIENVGAILATSIIPATSCVISPRTLTESTDYVNISYSENGTTVSTRISVTVEPALKSISVTTQPTTKTYSWGDSFNTAGLVVTATYTDNSSKSITEYALKIGDASINNGTVFNTSIFNIGSNTISVSYSENGKTADTTFNITINKKSLAIPIQSGTLTYNSTAQSPTLSNYNSTLMEISGNSQTNA